MIPLLILRTLLSSIPSVLDHDSTQNLINLLSNAKVCPGHPDEKFTEFLQSKKAKLLSRSNDDPAFLDSYAPVTFKGVVYESTVCPSLCEMIVTSGKCRACVHARPSINHQLRH